MALTTSPSQCSACEVKSNDLITCDECKKQVCDDDYDFEYQMCYLCSTILNEKEGYPR